jgi:hypothetical protein
MEYVIICGVSLCAAGLTLFSGFGLGTLLMPAFAFFFPVDIAIGMTAIVHLANNLFKLALLGKHANRNIIVTFGLPAIGAAFLGAMTLHWLSELQPLTSYELWGREYALHPIKLIVAAVMAAFAVLEVTPALEKLSLPKKLLPVGGFLSGYLGGLSGHQGALRSAVLIKAGLSKESFIATGVVIAVLVDLTRMAVYSGHIAQTPEIPILVAAIAAAFVGSFVGSKLVKKVTLKGIQIVVAIMLFAIAIMLGAGII